MKKVFKWIGILVLVIGVLIGCLVIFLKTAKPGLAKAPDIKIELTPERIERGRYLANTVTVCIDCHSKRDWTLYSAPPMPGTIGGGGDVFDRSMGFPGVYYARNITQLKSWTDGEIYRTITTGVDRNGEPLMPVMPYHNYGRMDTEDIYAIIAYVRTLPEIKNEIPKPESDFPFSLIIRTIPKEAAPEKRPAESDTLAYGKYLVNASGCGECHTQFEKGQLVAGTEFGGGRHFQMQGGILTTPNISPDVQTGIGSWTKEMFIQKFKSFGDSSYVPAHLDPTKDFMTMMPWTMYGKMKESDIAAIYAYLRTVDKKNNTIVKWQPGAVVASK